MQILLVDDAADYRLLIKAMLKKDGYTDIMSVESAQKAFEYIGLDRPSSGVEVDLILMDLIMPEINGIEACLIIKSVDHLRDIPIIIVTTSTEIESLEASFAAGAIDFINKPVNRVELLSRVRSVLTLKKEIDRRKARERELLQVKKQLEDANRELQLLTVMDKLTSIANRRKFDDFLRNEWRRAMREQQPLSLILLDLDFFKSYNDTYGHQMGDECLKSVAGALRDSLNRPADLVARYGGEEFAAILPNTKLVGAVHIAETFRTSVVGLKIHHKASPTAEHVSISAGVASVVPSRNNSPGQLVESADRALYEAKEAGRNRVKFATDLLKKGCLWHTTR